MFVIDTDLLSIMQRRSEPTTSQLKGRMNMYPFSSFHVTVVNLHEQILGANNFIARNAHRRDITFGYRLIELAMIDYERFQVLPFDEPSAIRFEDLRKQKVRIGTMDLRIASIALTHDFTVLTRNVVDSEKVSGLRCEDWTL